MPPRALLDEVEHPLRLVRREQRFPSRGIRVRSAALELGEHLIAADLGQLVERPGAPGLSFRPRPGCRARHRGSCGC